MWRHATRGTDPGSGEGFYAGNLACSAHVRRTALAWFGSCCIDTSRKRGSLSDDRSSDLPRVVLPPSTGIRVAGMLMSWRGRHWSRGRQEGRKVAAGAVSYGRAGV